MSINSYFLSISAAEAENVYKIAYPVGDLIAQSFKPDVLNRFDLIQTVLGAYSHYRWQLQCDADASESRIANGERNMAQLSLEALDNLHLIMERTGIYLYQK